MWLRGNSLRILRAIDVFKKLVNRCINHNCMFTQKMYPNNLVAQAHLVWQLHIDNTLVLQQGKVYLCQWFNVLMWVCSKHMFYFNVLSEEIHNTSGQASVLYILS